MNTLGPFIRHEMDNLPNETHNVPPGSSPHPAAGAPHAAGTAYGKDRSGLSDGYKARCIPSAQKNAEDFLAGDRPGLRQFYAPENAVPAAEQLLQSCSPTVYRPAKNTAVQDDESVERVVEWREEAPNG